MYCHTAYNNQLSFLGTESNKEQFLKYARDGKAIYTQGVSNSDGFNHCQFYYSLLYQLIHCTITERSKWCPQFEIGLQIIRKGNYLS